MQSLQVREWYHMIYLLTKYFEGALFTMALPHGIDELRIRERLCQHDVGTMLPEVVQVLGERVSRDADHHSAVAQVRSHPLHRLGPVHADHHIVHEHQVNDSAGLGLAAHRIQGSGAVVRLQDGAVAQHRTVRAALQHPAHNLPAERLNRVRLSYR